MIYTLHATAKGPVIARRLQESHSSRIVRENSSLRESHLSAKDKDREARKAPSPSIPKYRFRAI